MTLRSAAEHYENLLARYYSWMSGPDFDGAVAKQEGLLRGFGVGPASPGAVAIDLGCGPGYQSIALARLGYRTVALDTSAALLSELEGRKGGLPIEPVLDDLRRFDRYLPPNGAEIIVCMGDTLSHLESPADLERLVGSVARALRPGGRFVATYRDLSRPLPEGTDRFILLRGDADRIMTCFLEDSPPHHVAVHDLVHERQEDGRWCLEKSVYRKLRIASATLAEMLGDGGLGVQQGTWRGMVVLAAVRP